jgi:thiol-disulfide isomerase/thioredoxin
MKAHQFWSATRHALDSLYDLETGGPIERFIENDSRVGQITPGAIDLPIEGRLPSFDGTIAWLNSPPLSPESLRGKVLLVDFWTYTCINWLRTLPYVRAWSEKYRDHGLVVIGVHTPEFTVEHDLDNIRRAVEAMRISYPVAVDSDYAVWEAFANHYWPAIYLADAEGQIRYHQFGEGNDDRTEMVIQYLLTQAGYAGIGQDLVSVDPQGIEVQADWNDVRSPETYLGYYRADSFASPGGAMPDAPHTYAIPPELRLNEWALSGNWTVRAEPAVLNTAGGRIAYRFHARDLHLVLGPAAPGTSVRFRVRLDGQAPGAAHGADVDDEGYGTMTESRLYQLIRQQQPIVDRQFEIEFLDPGVEALVFTFG